MTSDPALRTIAELHSECMLESRKAAPEKTHLRELVLKITEQLLQLHHAYDSMFYGYQRLLNVTDTLLKTLLSNSPYSLILSDYLVLVESILMYEDLISSERLELFAKFTLMRHGETTYTNQGIDLTENGQQMILSKKDMLRNYVDKEKEIAILVSSGAARAKGTLGLIFPDEERYVNDLVIHIQTKDPKKVGAWFAQNFNSEWSAAQKIAHADRLYAEKRFPEDIFGPHGESEARFFYSAEISLRYAAKLRKSSKVPHFFVVSHFEFLNHLVMSVFNIQLGNTLMPGEHIEICAFTKSQGLQNIVPLTIRFRNAVAKAYLNREKRCIQSWTPAPLN